MAADPRGASALLPGVLVGHAQEARRPTGVTVVLPPDGTVGGVDVRGAAPGTRETDLLDPVNTVEVVHAVVLAGGSAFGLDAASGVMRWLEERGRGVPAGPARVPIVPAAVIFDLGIGDQAIRPDAGAGYRACESAVPIAEAAQGNVGAGAGATVGKMRGPDRMMRGGVGVADVRAGGVSMAAVVVVNAVGDVVDPSAGHVLAGARAGATSLELAGPIDQLLATGRAGTASGTNTTVGVLITDARISKAQATRLAQVAHDGLARTIRPVHTPMDGDTMFALATGTAAPGTQSGAQRSGAQRSGAPRSGAPQSGAQRSGAPAGSPIPAPDMNLLSILAAEVTASAVLNAIRAAEGLRIGDLWVPAWRDLS